MQKTTLFRCSVTLLPLICN